MQTEQKPSQMSDPRRPASSNGARPEQFGQVLARNITNLVEMRQRAARERSTQDRIADAITGFTGSMTFVALHAVLFGVWILVNLGLMPLVQPFDPTFVLLAMVTSVEAIFLSTFVLISQNRMTVGADKRAELDLQISLLAEHEVSQAVALLDAIAERFGVKHGPDAAIEEAKQDVNPVAVMEAIEDEEQERATQSA